MIIRTPSASPQSRSFGLRRAAIALSLVGGGFALGAATLAAAAVGDAPWHDGFHHHARVAFFQHVVHNALDNVGATTAQEDKIHDIIANTYTQLDADKPERGAMIKQALDLLKAPTIDRSAIEKLRAQKVADFDAKSKKIADALVEAASQLSPEQRAKLAQNVQAQVDHGWDHPHRHDRMNRPDGEDGGSDHDHG